MEWQQCDQCCARALVFYDLGGGRELAYCAHHSDVNLAKLSANAQTILDLRHIEAHA